MPDPTAASKARSNDSPERSGRRFRLVPLGAGAAIALVAPALLLWATRRGIVAEPSSIDGLQVSYAGAALWVVTACTLVAVGILPERVSAKPAIGCYISISLWSYVVGFTGYWTSCEWLFSLDWAVGVGTCLIGLGAFYWREIRWWIGAHVVPVGVAVLGSNVLGWFTQRFGDPRM